MSNFKKREDKSIIAVCVVPQKPALIEPQLILYKAHLSKKEKHSLSINIHIC